MPFDGCRTSVEDRGAAPKGTPPEPPRRRAREWPVDPAYFAWGVLIGLTVIGLVAWAL
jgi:hypothetical protein